jgi:hypothetical protein
MINMEELFDNWFEDAKITKTRLTIFTRQHLLAVEADNANGDYDDIIAATEPLLTTVENCLTDRSTKAAIEEGRVQAKDLFREQLPEKIRKLYAAVVVAYGDPSPDLTMCFPDGRTVFNRRGCKDEDLNNHLSQLKNALMARSATVGATHVTTITNLVTQWSALYEDRWQADADTDMSAAGQAAAVSALKVQLYKNVHTVAIFNLGNMEACHRLCPQSLLFPSAPLSPPGPCTVEVTGGVGQITCSGSAARASVIRWEYREVGGPSFTELGTSAPDEEVVFDSLPVGNIEVRGRGENDAGIGDSSELVPVEVT